MVHARCAGSLGQKNCELSEADIHRITDAFMAFEETEQSKIFPNDAFGYWKVTVERPLRIAGTDPERVYKATEISTATEGRPSATRTAASHHQEGTSYRHGA